MLIPPAVLKVKNEVCRKPVVGYEWCYEVSDRGDVKRIRSLKSGSVGQTIKPTVSTNGDRKVLLFADGVLRNKLVAEIVLEAFVGPRPRGCECWHLNGAPGDNRLSNLAWSPPRAEHKSGVSSATPKKHRRGKLSEANVAGIKRMLKQGMTGVEISRRYDVSKTAISMIKTGQRYTHGRWGDAND